ncbi:MAG: polysaccharide pyruvyl transferase family protein [Isosphaeraceae bacterium]
MMNRRGFLAGITGTLAAARYSWTRASSAGRAPRILLRGSWATMNIGDIGHTPGMLRLLTDALPDAEVTLWPSAIDSGVEPMLRRRFPKLAFATTSAELTDAFARNDFLLHGSGASLVAQKHVAQWQRQTGKPYGIYGITFASDDAEGRELLTRARFVFFRDSVSLKFAKDHGVACPVMEFGPDSAFGVDLRDDPSAVAFLREHRLDDGQFLCAIPRYRYTPRWLLNGKEMTAADREKDARNQAMKEHDHALIRQAIIAVVRQTRMKVLVCPEDRTQIAIGKAMLVDPLPDDVRTRVVWRDRYWLTDEALSVYLRSAGLFGLEMHSPIMAVANGVPAIVCRFAEQTSKGLMWRDIGLGDWLFDVDAEPNADRITRAVLNIATNPAAARARVRDAMQTVQIRQRATMDVLKRVLQEIV